MGRKLAGLALLIAVLLPLSLAGQSSTTDKTPRLETLVPPETMLLCSAPDVAGAVKKYKDTIPGKLVEYIFSGDFKNLMESFGAGGFRGEFPNLRDEMEKGIKKETGFTLDEFFDLFSGEIGFAMVNLKINQQASRREAPVKLDIVLKVGTKDQAKAEKFFRALTKKARGIKEYEVAGVKAFTIDGNDPVLPYWAFTPSCFILTTQEARLKEVVTAVMAGKGIEKNLTKDETYQIAARNTGKDAADSYMYWNWKRTQPLIQMGLMMVNPNALEDLGLDNIKAMAFSSRVKDGQFYDAAFIHTDGSKRNGLLKIVSTPKTETKDGILMTSSGDLSTLLFAGNSQIAIIAAIAIPGLMRSTLTSNEKSATSALREMVNQQAQWKVGDRDRNGMNDYWVLDLSCMYRVEQMPAGSGIPLQYLGIDVARADGNPADPKGFVYAENPAPSGSVNVLDATATMGPGLPIPKAGYLYRAIKNMSDGKPYAEQLGTAVIAATNVNRFGFIAYPLEYNVSGINTYIVNENGIVWKKDLGGETIDQWPKHPQSEGWSAID